MTLTEAGPTAARLLATWEAAGRRADLAVHRQVHGDIGRRRLPDLMAEIESSGLTGRGGGGFPTAAKLAAYRRHGTSVLAVNASEGEPASRKDAVLLGLVPHLVLDGADVAARLAGARAVAMCLHEGSDVLGSVQAAIAERRRARTDDLPTELVEVPARYLSGEESALANYVSSGRAVPVFRPSKSVPLSLRRRQSLLVHNAETLANLALLARHGATWFRAGGANGEGGTRLVTISGSVVRPGVYETPAGAPLGSVLERAGLSAPLVGILVGGFGGSFVSGLDLDRPYSPDGLRPAGAHPGAGVLVAVALGTCALAETARITRYMAAENAGQCGPCVFGLPAISSDLDLLASGAGNRADVDRLRRRLGAVSGRGGCAHPDGVVRMVGSALSVFEADLEAHVEGRGCGGRVGVVSVPHATGVDR